jgi:hypothetical protein
MYLFSVFSSDSSVPSHINSRHNSMEENYINRKQQIFMLDLRFHSSGYEEYDLGCNAM